MKWAGMLVNFRLWVSRRILQCLCLSKYSLGLHTWKLKTAAVSFRSLTLTNVSYFCVPQGILKFRCSILFVSVLSGSRKFRVTRGRNFGVAKMCSIFQLIQPNKMKLLSILGSRERKREILLKRVYTCIKTHGSLCNKYHIIWIKIVVQCICQ